MKKLIIAIGIIASTFAVHASVCSDTESVPVCRAWDVKITLKTLAPKKIKCPTELCTYCGGEADYAYYQDTVTRNLKGYLWICEYACGEAANIVLWDAKNKVAVIPYGAGEGAVSFDDDILTYGKKATKVAGALEFVGEDVELVAAGVNGKFVRNENEGDCYIKTLSGNVTGLIKYVMKSGVIAGTLCEDAVPESFAAKALAMCDACTFTNWCEADDCPEMVPATGTWSIKYNKKVSKGDKSIKSLIPAYAL